MYLPNGKFDCISNAKKVELFWVFERGSGKLLHYFVISYTQFSYIWCQYGFEIFASNN